MKPLLLGLALLLSSAPAEKVVGHNIQFMVNKKHELQPLLPVYLVVDQEEGGLTDPGSLTCDLLSRPVGEGMVMVLKCGNKKFLVKGMNFTESGK